MPHVTREHRPNRRMPWFFSLALSAFAVAPTFASGDTSSIQVQAQSTVKVAPDRATVRARLWEDTPAANLSEKKQREKHQDARRQAREALEKRATELITALEDDTGLSDNAISAGSLSVHPRREATPADRQGDDKRLIRTRLERPVTVQLDDLDKLEAVLGALMAADVNRLDGVTFDLKDRQAATDKALVKALKKARHKAELMAGTLDTNLGPVQHVAESRSPGFSPRMMSVSADSRGKAESSMPETEYRPGIVEIEAGVNVEWSLTTPSSAGSDEANVEASKE